MERTGHQLHCTHSVTTGSFGLSLYRSSCRDHLTLNPLDIEFAKTIGTQCISPPGAVMIVFPRPMYDQIVRQAYRGDDEEICGIIGGEYGSMCSHVTTVRQATNAAEVPTVRYHIDPVEQLDLTEQIEADEDEVVGFYHSHPAGPPAPSQTDTDRATWPDHSYVIVALDGYPYVGSWRWRADEATFEREQVVLTADCP